MKAVRSVSAYCEASSQWVNQQSSREAKGGWADAIFHSATLSP